MIDKFNSVIYIPYNSKITVLTNTNNSILKNQYKILYLLIENKKFIIVSKSCIIINKWANSITILKVEKNKNQIKINKEFENFLISLNSYLFKKIKFKGKGFRIKFFKKIKLIKFYFGKSHKTFLLLKKIKRKKINKYKFILFGLNKNRVQINSNIINKIKKINFYTLRGLRLSRQIIFKRKGKKGTYI